VQGHRELRHGGEVSGFVAANVVLPDDKIAVAVLTNQDASGAAARIADRTRDALLRAASAPSLESSRVVRKMIDDLADHHLDRTKLTANANAYFSDAAIDEFARTLEPLGAVQTLEQASSTQRGGMAARRYQLKYASKSLAISVYETPDGKIEQFLIDEDR
jgi:hypothetical protein